jgi:hypothetical protein
MKFLIIVLLLFLFVVLYNNKEGLNNYTAPLAPLHNVYKQMLEKDKAENVESDLAYFNNTSNLLYGFQRMPTL